MHDIVLLPALAATIEKIRTLPVPDSRKHLLKGLIAYIRDKTDQGKIAHLHFICTHNARRSQLAQIWCQTAADVYGIPAKCHSGGTEVTSFNERAVASLQRSGFRITAKDSANPRYAVQHSEGSNPIIAYSKRFDDPANPANGFAAVMTCSHADAHCPVMYGTEKRIALLYDDPKEFDNTALEALKYDERSMQIAAEMLYAFSVIE